MEMRDIQPSVLIFANGKMPQKHIIHNFLEKADCIIAADGGSNYCYQQKIFPHYIIGDLDSIDSKAYDHFQDSHIIHQPDQDRHDLDKALEFAQTLKPKTIWVLGGFGKRLDHTLANLLLLQSTESHCPLSFIDDYGQLSLISGKYQLNCSKNRIVSLFSFLPVWGISLSGFKYSLKDKDFANGFSGLSNVSITDHPTITLNSGSLYLYIIHENITI